MVKKLDTTINPFTGEFDRVFNKAYLDSVYLWLSGGNANQDIDIGAFDFSAERVTADNLLYKEAQLGVESVENRVLNSKDFTKSITWSPAQVDVTSNTLEKNSFLTIAYVTALTDGIDSNLIGKSVTLIVKCIGTQKTGQEVSLQLNDFTLVGDETFRLLKDNSTTIRVTSSRALITPLTFKIGNFDNTSFGDNWALTVESIILMEAMPTALVAFGDSNTKTAVLSGDDFVADSYTYRYGEAHNITIKNYGASSGRISWVTVAIQNLGTSVQYPLLSIQSGLNDIFLDGAEVSEMIIDLDAALVEAKKISAKIILYTIPPVIGSGGNWTGAMETKRDDFNIYVRTLDSDVVRVVDLDLTMVGGDFDTDGFHITPTGHLKIVTATELAVAFPVHIDTYADMETKDNYIYNVSDVLNENANHIVTVTEDYTATNKDRTIIIDASANDVEVTLPAFPDTGKKFNIVCLDSTNTAEVNFNSKNFYDSSANEVLFKGENLKTMYDGTQYIGD